MQMSNELPESAASAKPSGESGGIDLDPVVDAKRELRRGMRALRKSLTNRTALSAQITEHLIGLEVMAQASRVLAYASIVGEVETAGLIDWCRSNGTEVALPEDDDLDAQWPDVIVVPGTAFTIRGERIGQGGGWYDQFLPGRRTDAVTIGIGFSPQLVDSLPTEPHDVILDCIVTEDGPIWPHA